MSDLTRRLVVQSASERSGDVRGDSNGSGADQGWKSGLGVGGVPRESRLLLMVREGRADSLLVPPREGQCLRIGLSASLPILRLIQR